MRNTILWISIIPMIYLVEINCIPHSVVSRNADQTSMSNSRDKRDSDIQFPDEQIPFVRTGVEPKCAQGATFCEEVDNYPTGHIDMILQRSSHKYNDLFGADLILPDNVVNRYNGINEEESLCRSKERLIYPKTGLSQDNTWKFIVNHDNKTQGVVIEQCDDMKLCEMADNFPIRYEARCKQKYIYRQLISIDERGNTIKDLFRLPSCCQCVLKLRGANDD